MVELNVNGKVAIVTGGARGLGFYCSKILVKANIKKLIITSRNLKNLERSREELLKLAESSETEILIFENDLSSYKGVEKFYHQVLSLEIKKIDLLILNSGATWGEPLETHPESALHKVFDLNVVGLFHTIQLFTPMLTEAASVSHSRPSRILIISSVAGLVSSFPTQGTYGYNMSKSAIIHLAKNLALELAPQFNINVNVICPGFFPTKMSNGVLEKNGQNIIDNNPRRRLGIEEDLEYLVLYLCCDQSNYLNGVIIPVDGGSYLGNAVTSKM
ncbi:hypothetical protein PACTADRAFT_48670 [Pachysolen tannophilus NRRL Y-2460]|uniref:Uncharacterized protein n=1 Tax=Pachysolen tannophilus NRRL Y-2460 TaxID=669874 RepID=A0A1E4TYP9_PACTA|nr:hypothetical protein PACTADRAFT_48670 [Pachysolen tannophilus NRRL Y-2460]